MYKFLSQRVLMKQSRMYNSAAEETDCWDGRGRPHVTLLTSCDRGDGNSKKEQRVEKKCSEAKIITDWVIHWVKDRLSN